jgi:hypothetical protein
MLNVCCDIFRDKGCYCVKRKHYSLFIDRGPLVISSSSLSYHLSQAGGPFLLMGNGERENGFMIYE